MANSRKSNQNYFAYVNPVFAVLVVVGFALLILAIAYPDEVPTSFGRFGDFVRHLGKNRPSELRYLGVVSVILHVLEAIYGYTLCRQLGLSRNCCVKWFVQTSIFGMFSLRTLIKYKSSKLNQHKKVN
ncbi:hypothetical protein CHUAL_005898 [Chamberlinius hualienensis]